MLTDVPETMGNLHNLQALKLCDNLIEVLPASIARLTNLKSLLLHKNRLRHLPRDIITLQNLVEVMKRRDRCWTLLIPIPLQLSLRDNPLVVRFVQEISLNPPSLRELSARVVRTAALPHGPEDLPRSIREYLGTAHCCVNPKCKGTVRPRNASANG